MDEKKDKFLEIYVKVGTVAGAASGAGVSRARVYQWLNEDSNFKERFEHTRKDVADNLEAKAIERAMAGLSDTLLIFLLKGLKPDKYRERQDIRHSGDKDNPITYVQVPPPVGK